MLLALVTLVRPSTTAAAEPARATPAATSPVPAASRQLLLVTAASWDATTGEARLFRRAAEHAEWRPVGSPMPVSLGRAGLAWGRGLHAAQGDGPQKREGDGRSPAGVFELRGMTGYAATPPAGTSLEYEEATPTLRCVDDPGSSRYNQLADESRVPKDWRSAEDMRRDDELYRLVVWVGHNDAPTVAGGGSCIFLHLRRGVDSVTAGCTAFDARDLEWLVAHLEAAAHPVLVQLPEAQQRALADAWGLPKP